MKKKKISFLKDLLQIFEKYDVYMNNGWGEVKILIGDDIEIDAPFSMDSLGIKIMIELEEERDYEKFSV